MAGKLLYQWPDRHQSADLSDWVEHASLPEAREHAAEALHRGWVSNWLLDAGDHDGAKRVLSSDLWDRLQVACGTNSLTEDADLRRQEDAVKLKELDVRGREAEKALAQGAAPWWRRADPLFLAVIVGAFTIAGNMLVAYFNSRTSLAQEREKADNELKLEKQKARYTLILQAIGTGDPKTAEQNIKFFIDAGLLQDEDEKIAKALLRFRPVLPSAGATSRPQPLEVPEIARIYNFPTQFDGSGQTIGLLEFGGGYRAAELAAYFLTAHLPMPQVTEVPVGGVRNKPGDVADGQVTLDIEIVGTIAPKANIRVYFSQFTGKGVADAVSQAVADGVSIISIGWGMPESEWGEADVQAINRALQRAAEKGATVVAAAGDGGVTDRVKDGNPHVDFPASSPWVLAVGGTKVVTSAHQIVSETVWNDKGGGATGGGVSERFDRPAWQAGVQAPARKDGKGGRAVPDVAALADPSSGALVRLGGQRTVVGGTSVSAAVWAGLLALVNQGLGHNVGHLNPLLYQKAGPAGVLQSVTQGDNSTDGVKGYSAGPGWNPVAGWGSPNGTKLLEWLRTHP
jgi:kumamolisin